MPSREERGNVVFVASSTASNDGGGGSFNDVTGTLTQVAGGPIGSYNEPGPQISNGNVVFNAGDTSTDIGRKLHPVTHPPISPDCTTFNHFGTVDTAAPALHFQSTTT